MSRLRAAVVWTALGLVAGVGPALSQTITNVSVAKNPGNSADYINLWPSNTHGQIASAVQLTSAGANEFETRYAAIVTADSELFGLSAVLTLASDYTIHFTVNAPAGYRVTVRTRRKGEMTLHEDNIFVADHFADVTALSGAHSGGTLVSGDLNLVDPGIAMDIPFVFDPIFVAFDQTKTAIIDGTSNGADVNHTLTFTWSQQAASPAQGDEAAVRLGGTSLDPDETAGNYPGSPARVKADDGHFVTVTVEPLCGDGVLGAGEDCDEGAATGSPASCCTATCALRAAGATCRGSAGACDVAEQCDGANGACPANDFAASGTVCRAASAGQECDEPEVCPGTGADCPADAVLAAGTQCRAAVDLCDVAEQCDGVSKLCPEDDEHTDPCVAPGCAFGPLAGCRTAEKTLLVYKDKENNVADKLLVRWSKGQSTTQSEFADPTTSSAYDLCVYAGSAAALLLEATVPADANKWDTLGTSGYSYKDPAAEADGAQRILMKGSESAKTKILWKGRGMALPDVVPGTLPLAAGDFPLLAQFMNTTSGVCFETSFEFDDVIKNSAEQLKLKDP